MPAGANRCGNWDHGTPGPAACSYFGLDYKNVHACSYFDCVFLYGGGGVTYLSHNTLDRHPLPGLDSAASVELQENNRQYPPINPRRMKAMADRKTVLKHGMLASSAYLRCFRITQVVPVLFFIKPMGLLNANNRGALRNCKVRRLQCFFVCCLSGASRPK